MTNVNMAWKYLVQIITRCANKLCPLRNVKSKSSNTPWITNEILEAMHDRNYYFELFKTSNDPDILLKAKVLRAEVKKAIRNAKTEYIKNQLEGTSGNPKKIRQQLKCVLNPNVNNQNITQIRVDDHVISDNQAMAEEINNYFTTIGEKLGKLDDSVNPQETISGQISSNLPTTSRHNAPTSKIPHAVRTRHKYELGLITSDMYMKKINEINVYKSSGIDNISTRLLKDYVDFRK